MNSLESLRFIIHYGIHFLLPLGIAFFVAQKRNVAVLSTSFLGILVLLNLNMLIDLDHFWSSPVFDPNRCSIGFHALHQPEVAALSVVLLAVKKVRLVAAGVIIHFIADGTDCWLMKMGW